MGDIAEKIYSVAVDGPSGAGKSSLAKAIAAELHILYVDTGAIYRTIGCYARRKGVEAADTEAVIALLPEVKIGMRYDAQGLQHMLLHGEDVTEEDARKAEAVFTDTCPDAEVSVLAGGQPVYYYIVSIE